jgi:phage gp46-like protein
MTDIRIIQFYDPRSPLGLTLDWLLLDNGALDESNELAAAFIVALGTDARADPSDDLPDLPNPTIDPPDYAGWWGDLDAAALWNGWPIGSKLWLLRRAKITDDAYKNGSLLGRVEQYIMEALAPFRTLKVCSDIEVTVYRGDFTYNEVWAHVVAYRGPATVVDLQYLVLWNDVRP